MEKDFVHAVSVTVGSLSMLRHECMYVNACMYMYVCVCMSTPTSHVQNLVTICARTIKLRIKQCPEVAHIWPRLANERNHRRRQYPDLDTCDMGNVT